MVDIDHNIFENYRLLPISKTRLNDIAQESIITHSLQEKEPHLGES